MDHQVRYLKFGAQVDVALRLIDRVPSDAGVKRGDVDLTQGKMTGDCAESRGSLLDLSSRREKIGSPDHGEAELNLYRIETLFQDELGEAIQQRQVDCDRLRFRKALHGLREPSDFAPAQARGNPKHSGHISLDKSQVLPTL